MKMDIELQGKFIQLFDFFNIYYQIQNNLDDPKNPKLQIAYGNNFMPHVLLWFQQNTDEKHIDILRTRLDDHAQGLLLCILSKAYDEDIAKIINNLSTNHSDFYSDMVKSAQKYNLPIDLSEDVLHIGQVAMTGFNHRM